MDVGAWDSLEQGRGGMLTAVPALGAERWPKEVTLKAVCGPGDDRKPVITVMLPEED